MARFVTVNRDTAYLLPPSVDEWLPKEHLAQFVVQGVEHLDLSALIKAYAGRGSDTHPPAVLPGPLVYGYATAVYSSRVIERATFDSIAFRYIAGNTHPAQINPKAQVNLTDEESRIMPRAGGGFDQCYKAQLSVEIESRLIMTTGLTQSTVDKQQVVPALETLAALPEPLKGMPVLITDNGYVSEAHVNACAGRAITPLFALGREGHHISLEKRFALELVGPPPEGPLAAMKHQLKTKAGKTLYALRKSTVEPVIGIIKSVMGFRQFPLRGLTKVTGEWNLVCLACSVKRLGRLQAL